MKTITYTENGGLCRGTKRLVQLVTHCKTNIGLVKLTLAGEVEDITGRLAIVS